MELNKNEMNALSEKIAEEMLKMGIKVIDNSIYFRNGIKKELYYTSIIVGYIPKKAAIFIVEIEAEGHLKFVIENQIKEEFDDEIMTKAGRFFPKLQRNALGGEWSTSINTFIRASVNESDRIGIGINFFRNFLAFYGNMLKEEFVKRITLHAVPYNSNAFAKARTILDRDRIALTHKDRIIELLPAGFFPEKNKLTPDE